MKCVDFSIKGVNMSSSFDRTDSWTVCLCTTPLTAFTYTVKTHTHFIYVLKIINMVKYSYNCFSNTLHYIFYYVLK